MKSNASSSENTRAELVRVARKLFAKGGQRAVGVIEVSKAAKVTTGALYHHFTNRQALLTAVLEDIAQSVGSRAGEAMAKFTDPWERLGAGIDAVLDLCLEPDVKLAYNEAAAISGSKRGGRSKKRRPVCICCVRSVRSRRPARFRRTRCRCSR